MDRKDELLRIAEVMKDNTDVVRRYSEYLNYHPGLLEKSEVERFAKECGIGCDEAFRALFCAALELDTADNRHDRMLERRYILPGLRKLDPGVYRNDEYITALRFPNVKSGRWEMCERSYAPYEPFACNHPVITEELYEIPQIGYFEEEFRFPAVLEDGIEWMTVTPNEAETMREPIRKARGKVLTLGLGLGYFTFHASQKANVTSVTVVEKDTEIIGMFKEYLLPQFPKKEKIRIVEADAFEYMEKAFPGERFDYAFEDLWHDASDGLEMYMRLKRYEKTSKGTEYDYWIEPSMLSVLRHMVAERLTDERNPFRVTGADPRSVLTDAFLKTLDLKKQ